VRRPRTGVGVLSRAVVSVAQGDIFWKKEMDGWVVDDLCTVY